MEYTDQEIKELNNQLYEWQIMQKNIMAHPKFKDIMREYGDMGKIIWDNIKNAKTFKDSDKVVWGTFNKFINIVSKEICD